MAPRGIQLWWLLVTVILARLTSAEIPDNTFEIDLVFPRAGGRYAETDDGLPVLLSIHNPNVAYLYGYRFWWDIYEQPHRTDYWNHSPRNLIGTYFGNGTTFSDAIHLESDARSDRLEAGNYTFHWQLRGGAVCEITRSSAQYDSMFVIGNGSFGFAVESGAPTPTFTGTCPTALGAASFRSATVYRGLPWDEEHGDPATQTLGCGVTAGVTATPEPCRATVDAAQEASLSRRLHWGAFATASTARTGSASGGGGVSLPLMGLMATLAVTIWEAV
ncbi:hypothetical protein C8035_v012456 [Colletotrichum spinosum]|uniref:DUF7136 domain-containing protein n=1 Tax=Colletotrichum spinosum TaxID=1347390 RepID=A0A4R8Q290_9PEZI|nr:hypothetical protein C8035_v012456 [Colletotrichum spinosum]